MVRLLAAAAPSARLLAAGLRPGPDLGSDGPGGPRQCALLPCCGCCVGGSLAAAAASRWEEVVGAVAATGSWPREEARAAALGRCFCIGAAGFPGACGRQEVAVLHIRLFAAGREDAGAAAPGHGRRGVCRGVRCHGGCGMR